LRASRDYGFKAIIAPSFGDIFATNATKTGLLPVRLAEDEVRAVAEAGRPRSTSRRSRSARRADVPLRARPRDPATGCSTASTTSADAAEDDAIAAVRARARAPGPVTTASPV
jgi:3-isopropylmalate/(R)-2-methylmalate dehydratase small subunit